MLWGVDGGGCKVSSLNICIVLWAIHCWLPQLHIPLILILIQKMLTFQLFLIHLCKCEFRLGQQPYTMGQVIRTNCFRDSSHCTIYPFFCPKIQSVTVTSPTNWNCGLHWKDKFPASPQILRLPYHVNCLCRTSSCDQTSCVNNARDLPPREFQS